MFKSLIVPSTYIKKVFTLNNLTIYCSLSVKTIGQEFDIPKSRKYFSKLAIKQLNSDINLLLLHCHFYQSSFSLISVQLNLDDLDTKIMDDNHIPRP